MQTKKWTDEMIIHALTGKDEAQYNLGLYHVMQNALWKKTVSGYVLQHGGNTEDVEDVFQEAVIAFERAVRKEIFKGESSLITFFVSIAKRKWWSIIKRRKPTEEIAPHHVEQEVESAEDYALKEEKKHFLAQALSRIGERCKKILQLYQLDYSMEEIAAATGISSADMAKKEAYRCRVRLRQFFDDNPGWKNLIK